MTEEEKEAIKYFYNLRATIDESNMLFDEDINVKCGKAMIKQITTILNLLEKKDIDIIETKEANRQLSVELQKKDKILDLMIKVMIDSGICDYFIKQNCKHYAGENKKLCDVCIKEYFEKKVEGEK